MILMDHVGRLTQANKIELHYWMNDDSHTMDAFTLNKCEWEFINLLKEIAETAGIDIKIESVAISEGGLIQNFKIAIRKCKEGSISYGVLMTLITGLVGTPLSIGGTKYIESLFEDEEIIQLDKDAKRVEIDEKKANTEYLKALTENTKADTDRKETENKLLAQKIAENTKIKKRSSNFYENIAKEKKIEKISVNLLDAEDNTVIKEKTILKSDFSKYILLTNEMSSTIDENAIIEIISPVLNKGKYKWKGLYNGRALDFSMKSNEFKSLVQTGQVEFKYGTYIKCILEMPRVINNDGDEEITSYNILKVISFYNINKSEVLTKEGKKHIREKEFQEKQLNFFSDLSNDEE